MKTKMILKLLFIFSLALSSCNKDDDNKDEQGCVKEENYFEAQFDGQTIEPYYNQGGGIGRYTLSFSRCVDNENDWLLTINTENDIGFDFSLIGLTGIGNYNISAGNPEHIAVTCAVKTSIYIEDQDSNSYTFISSSNGTIEITGYDNSLGILIGTFTAELVSTADPSVKKTITGEFNLNKSTLDKTIKPCWL